MHSKCMIKVSDMCVYVYSNVYICMYIQNEIHETSRASITSKTIVRNML